MNGRSIYPFVNDRVPAKPMRTAAEDEKNDEGNAFIVLFSNLNLICIVIKIPNPKAICSTVQYFSLQAAVLVISKQIEFSDIFRYWTFYEDTIVMITDTSTANKLV